MRLKTLLTHTVTLLAAAAASYGVAGVVVALVERTSEQDVSAALDGADLVWADVETNGLQVRLSGTAPSEAERFRAMTVAGQHVDATRIINTMRVQASEALAPPRFSLEILRNEAGISLIGLVPLALDRGDLLKRVRASAPNTTVSDFLNTADHPMPGGFEAAVDFAVQTLADLPQSKISVDAERVAVTAMTESLAMKRATERALERKAPGGVSVVMEISAPRPVITPFAVRFIKTPQGAKFDACSADTPQTRERILNAAIKAGAAREGLDCTLGLGVPSARWADAVEVSLEAMGKLGPGSLTFSNADITLKAAQDTDPAKFDQIVGELENALPELFALHPVLPPPSTETEAQDQGPKEFFARLSAQGEVVLSGRINGQDARTTTTSFAQARFGSKTVQSSARLDETLPDHWPVRVLAGLEALDHLANGSVKVTLESIEVSGRTGSKSARADISKLFAKTLGEQADFSLDITYDKRLDPTAGLPTPEECESQIAQILKVEKLVFEPGSDQLDAAGAGVMDSIATVLKRCEDIPLEIGGHTDSQGREIMNEQLSQSRAETILNELRARRIPTASLRARGYGETQPIEDNRTEEGREANRRIEFRLMRETEAESDTPPTQETATQGE